MARRSQRNILRETSLNKKMTVKEIKSYIRKATDEINKKLKKNGTTGFEVLDEEVDIIKEKYGFKKRKGKEELKYGFSGKRKEDLYKQATDLRAYFNLDVFTRDGKTYLTEREQRAYEQFKKTTDIQLGEETYRKLLDVFGNLGSGLMESLGSDNIANLYNEYKITGGRFDFVDLVKEIIEENQGVTQDDVVEIIQQELQDRL